MKSELSSFEAHMYLDAVIHNDKDFGKFIQAELPRSETITSLFQNYHTQSSENVTIGHEKFHVYHYTKTYDAAEQIGKFFKGLILTVFTLGFGLIDQRVRHNWEAAFLGIVEKHIAISERVTVSSFGTHVFTSLINDPVGTVNKVAKFGEKFFHQEVVKPARYLDDIFAKYLQ